MCLTILGTSLFHYAQELAALFLEDAPEAFSRTVVPSRPSCHSNRTCKHQHHRAEYVFRRKFEAQIDTSYYIIYT